MKSTTFGYSEDHEVSTRTLHASLMMRKYQKRNEDIVLTYKLQCAPSVHRQYWRLAHVCAIHFGTDSERTRRNTWWAMTKALNRFAAITGRGARSSALQSTTAQGNNTCKTAINKLEITHDPVSLLQMLIKRYT